MRRRELITLLGGAAVAWPWPTRAQPAERVRRVGVLSTLTADDPEGRARIAVFRDALQALGWSEGRNLQLDVRWSAADAGGLRDNAAELAAQAEVILAAG